MYYPSSENKGADQLRGYRENTLKSMEFSESDEQFMSIDCM